MTDFRALCEELLEWADRTSSHYFIQADVVVRARAALTEDPVGPTDEEIMEMMPQQMRDDLAAAARALARFHQGSDLKSRSIHRIILNRHAVDHARAVLAKWGQPCELPTTQPIPVSERLPQVKVMLRGIHNPTAQPVAVSKQLPGDALSWWYEPDEDDDEGYGGKWTLLRIRGAIYTYTHWLPANALPTPKAQ